MSSMMESSESTGVTTGIREAETPLRLTTTLHDLMVVLQDVVGAPNEALVVATVVHLLRSGRLTWLRTDRVLRDESPTEAVRQCGACHPVEDLRLPGPPSATLTGVPGFPWTR
jgi:hypothetical protein